MDVTQIDMEKYRMVQELNALTAGHYHCDGRCAFGECICPEEGWEEYTEKKVSQDILKKVKLVQQKKIGLQTVIDYIQEQYGDTNVNN